MTTLQLIVLSGPAYEIVAGKTNSGNEIITFKVKTWREKGKGHDDKVCFFKVVAYGGSARVLSEYLTDGKKVVIKGTPDLYKDSNGVERFQVITESFSW